MKATLGLSLLVPRMNRRDPHTLVDWTNLAFTCLSASPRQTAEPTEVKDEVRLWL